MMKKRLLALLLAVVMLGSLFTQALATETDPTEAPTVPETTAAATEPEVTEEPTVPETTAPATEPTVPETTAPATEPEETEEPTVPETTEAATEPEVTEEPTVPEETENEEAETEEDEELEEDEWVDEEEYVDDDGYVEGEFETPVDFTNVADVLAPVKNFFRSAVKLFSFALNLDEDDEGDTGDGDIGDEEEPDDGSGEDEENPDEGFVRTDNPNIMTEKTVIYDEATKSYKLRLESYLTGEPTITTDERVPSDIVIVLDQSGSMDDCFYCGDDKADSRVKVYSGLSLSKTYYVKAAITDTTGTAVYYCKGDGTCGYVKADGTKTHTAGWYAKKHTTSMSSPASTGTRYYASIGDADNKDTDNYTYKSRIFYTNKNMTTKASYAILQNGRYYYYTNNKMNRLYYCSECCAWYMVEEHSADNHKRSTAYYPDATSSDDGHRAVTFYHWDCKHYVTDQADLPSYAKTFYMKATERTTGDTYRTIYHITENKWNSKKNGNGTTYEFPEDFIDGRIYYQCPTNRNKALKEALNIFLTDIYKDSMGADGKTGGGDDVDNRIAVVGFGSYNATTSSGVAPTNALLSYSTDGKTAQTIGYSALRESYYKKGLHSVNTANGQALIKDAVDSLQMVSNTETYKGIAIGNNIFEYNEIATGEERNRIMVVFTDGYPYSPNTDSQGVKGNFAFADDAIKNAYTTKNTHKATVYSIGIFSGANASNMVSTCSYTGTTNSKRANKFMHLISSNYLNTKDSDNLTTAYTASDVNPNLKTGSSYYLSASTTTALNDIFKSIAQSIAGGGAYITTLDSTTVVKDVVSNKFVVDTDREVYVHTESFAGEENGKMTWKSDENIQKIDANGNTVEYTGFDFALNYVATDTYTDTDGNKQYRPRGKKLVIEIPIDPASDNDGGYQQATNVQTGSGIFLKGECYEHFDLPTVDIPTDISVKKTIVGANVPADKKFNFKIEYDQFNNSYEGDDESSGNYLDANHDALEANPSLGNNESQPLTEVLVGSTITITESGITDYLVEYRIGSGEWKTATKSGDTATITETVTAGMDIDVRNTLLKADLVITKNVDKANPDQSFLFNVTNDEGLNIPVVIPASAFGSGTSASVTIKDLEVGAYTVSEDTSWSWRYTLTDDNDKTVNVTSENGGAVSFTNNRTNVYWMDGESHAQNIFN